MYSSCAFRYQIFITKVAEETYSKILIPRQIRTLNFIIIIIIIIIITNCSRIVARWNCGVLRCDAKRRDVT